VPKSVERKGVLRQLVVFPFRQFEVAECGLASLLLGPGRRH
jgi:hypothetical protein